MASREVRRLPVSPGRPRRQLDEALLVELAGRGWGFKRIAGEYTARTGAYLSHMTVRDRLPRDGCYLHATFKGDHLRSHILQKGETSYLFRSDYN